MTWGDMVIKWGIRPFTVLAIMFLAFVLAACGDDDGGDEAGSGGDLQPVHLTLEWVTQTEFAGYYAGVDQGFYAEEGIELTIQPGGPDVNPVQLLLAGETDIAINSFANALVAREEGADVISIGQVFERSAYRLVSFADKGITSAADFEGKTIGLWGGFHPSFSATMTKNGLDPDTDAEIFSQGFDMTALFDEQVDLASAMVYNEYAQALAGAGDREIAVFDFNEEGTNTLENALIVRRDWAEENPELAEGFIRATIKGWIHCRENPEECVDIVLGVGTALPYNFQLWQMNEINKMIWPSTGGVLALTPDAFNQTADILFDFEVISERPTEESFDMSYRDRAIGDFTEDELFARDFVALELNPDELFAEETDGG